MEDREGRLIDAHCHLGTEAERRIREGQSITSLMCAGTPKEAKVLFDLLRSHTVITPSVGLHPWFCREYAVEEMMPYFEKAAAVGEIGMDSVWCQVPLEVQERAFRSQLLLAEELHKPVVLHTKGQEKRIAAILREYTNRYLVHWYSSMEHLEEYLALDCYFTVGPDLQINPAVRQVAMRAPLDRILVETDGMEAVAWALGRRPVSDLGMILKDNISLLADMRQVSFLQMEAQMETNFNRYIGRSLFTLK